MQVQTDALCRDLNLQAAPAHLPSSIQSLDLSQNQVQNLTRDTLANLTHLRLLNLHNNRLVFIQPQTFRALLQLQVLDLSRNLLSVFARSRTPVGRLPAVTALDLSSNGLFTGMSDYFLDAPRLQLLSLSSNSITRIRQDAFSRTPVLQKISLHNNVILDIEDGAFDSLDRLQELDLSKNSITCITDFNLWSLKVLNLSQNSMERFCSAAATNRSLQLQRLDLSQNKLRQVPLLPRGNVLTHLDLSRNQLQSLNVTGGDPMMFSRLKFLDLSFNQLQSVEDASSLCLWLLDVLNVSNNCIRSFSIRTRHMKNVTTINLSFNSLQTLQLDHHSVPLLQELLLQGNLLSSLDLHTFRRLPSLKHLELQQNQLQVCGPARTPPGCLTFSSMEKLRFLNLSENAVTNLPPNAFAGTPLNVLDVSLNPGLDMDNVSLSGLDSLVHLSLKKNNISSVQDVWSLRSLRHLDLSDNQLVALPPLGRAALETLNLQRNRLQSLDAATMSSLLRSLRTVYLGSNPLSCCSNAAVLRALLASAVRVADIDSVTCVLGAAAPPLAVRDVAEDTCRGADLQSYVVAAVVATLLLVGALALLLRCCHRRKHKHTRSFSA